MTRRNAFFTIGHSTRSIEEFACLLQAGEVTTVVDIRTVRRSRRNPQYNEDILPQALGQLGIPYHCIPKLGGLRKRSKEIAPHLNGLWRNQSFHNYADYALGESFREGLDELVELGARQTCCLMCAEAVWWRCHRRIVCDYLLARRKKVLHLMGKDRKEEATLTPGAHIAPGGLVTYPLPPA